MKKILSIATAILAVSAAGAAQAQTTPWYGAVSFGQSKSNVKAGEINDFLSSKGYGSPSTTVDDKDNIYRFALGYRFSPVVSLEGFYADLGKYNSRSTVTTPLPGAVDADYKAKGYGLDVVLSAPVTPEFSVYGRVGIVQAKVDASFRAAGSLGLLSSGGSSDKTGQHYGVGVQYDFTPVFGVRGEWETYRKLGDDSTGGELKGDAISLGAVFRF